MTALPCILDACRTTKDGGWVVAFACGQDQVEAVAEISQKRDQQLYVVVMTQEEFEASKVDRNRRK